MTKETLIKNYRKYSAADCYIIGFIYDHEVYMAMVDEIMPRFLKIERDSMKNGGSENLRIRLNKKYKKQLLKKAICLGSEEIITNNEYKNKGVQFEKLVSEFYGIKYRGKDSVPFYVSGDLRVDNKEIQIKFDGANLTNAITINRLKKGKRKSY